MTDSNFTDEELSGMGESVALTSAVYRIHGAYKDGYERGYSDGTGRMLRFAFGGLLIGMVLQFIAYEYGPQILDALQQERGAHGTP